jgi:hypothetical protein
LTLHTNGVKSGEYPVRITVLNRNGAFVERVPVIRVVSYVDALSKITERVDVIDSFAYGSYQNSFNIIEFEYSTSITHRPGDPANRFLFSNIFKKAGGGTLWDRLIDVDTMSGELTVVNPPQNGSGINFFKAEGRITKSESNYRGFNAYFFYSYEETSGGKYEGHLYF